MIANHNHRRLWLWIAAALAGALQGASSCAAEQREEVETMKRQIEALQKQMADVIQVNQEKQKRIETLEQQVKSLQEAPRAAKIESSLDKALAKLDAASESKARAGSPLLSYSATAPRASTGAIRLADVSVDMLMAGGTSTANEDQLHPNLQGGCHDPKKRGFTIQQTELSFSGAVDPYFNFESHMVATHHPITGETGLELEEAYATTTSMPFGLQMKAGHFLTEFGRMNPTHPHTWTYLDQAIINSRLFGGDGLRNPGARVSWLAPAPWFSLLYVGAQNATGETAVSFIGNEAIGGRPVDARRVHHGDDLLYTARWENSVNLSETLTTLFGVSGLHGPNNTGPSGETWIGGLDFMFKWRPPDTTSTGHFVTWRTELMGRNYIADRFENEAGVVPSGTVRDWGFYSQVEAGISRSWSAALRFDYATGTGPDYSVGEDDVARVSRQLDPLRDTRWRLSPLLNWRLSEFSRVRFQYNLDRADHLRNVSGHDDPYAHSLWMGLEVMIGAHPAHNY